MDCSIAPTVKAVETQILAKKCAQACHVAGSDFEYARDLPFGAAEIRTLLLTTNAKRSCAGDPYINIADPEKSVLYLAVSGVNLDCRTSGNKSSGMDMVSFATATKAEVLCVKNYVKALVGP